MNKRLLGSLLSVFVLALLLTASPVLAGEVDVDGTNEKTGAKSDNDNTFDIDENGDTTQKNKADVDNHVKAKANSGKNDQNKNTTGGDTDTGSIDASADWKDTLNNGADILGGSLDVDGDFVNDTTGYKSDNDNLLDLDLNGDVKLGNYAKVRNWFGLKANTGYNDSNRNTMGGDTDTGDINADVASSTDANNDSGFASAAGSSVDVDVEAGNNTTGADSDNTNTFDIDLNGNTSVKNKAKVTNKTHVHANTGGNEQNRNTTGGDTNTGDIDVSTDNDVSANNGSSVASAGSDSTDISGDFSNDTTGADSDNDNVLDYDNNGHTEVENSAEVDNATHVDANSGDNEQNRNTEGGDTSTGDITIDVSSSSDLNND